IVVISIVDPLDQLHRDQAEQQDLGRVWPEAEALRDLEGAEPRPLVEQREQPDIVRGPEDLKAHRPAQRREEAIFALLEPASEERRRGAAARRPALRAARERA